MQQTLFGRVSPKPQLLPMLVLSFSLLEHETWSDDGHGSSTFYTFYILQPGPGRGCEV